MNMTGMELLNSSSYELLIITLGRQTKNREVCMTKTVAVFFFPLFCFSILFCFQSEPILACSFCEMCVWRDV